MVVVFWGFWSSLFTTLVLHLLNLSPGFGCWFPSSLDICLPSVTCHTCPYPQSYLPTGAGDFCSHYLLACLLVALGGRMVDFGSCVFVTRITCLFTATSWLLVICPFVSLSHLKGMFHPHFGVYAGVIFRYLFGCFPHLVAVGEKKGYRPDPWQKKGNSPGGKGTHPKVLLIGQLLQYSASSGLVLFGRSLSINIISQQWYLDYYEWSHIVVPQSQPMSDGGICQGPSQCDPTHVQPPQKSWPLGWGSTLQGGHKGICFVSFAGAAQKAELGCLTSTQPLTARSRQTRTKLRTVYILW